MTPKITFHKPADDAVAAFLDAQSKLGFTYAAVGATATVPPPGYNVDHSRIKLGEGERVFQAAKAALQNWTQFRLGWVEARSFEPSLRVRGMVAVVGWSVGLWWLNACRIVYVVEEGGPVVKFGFAYGTLPAHMGSGEERFLVEWDRRDDAVWYDILAFSKPHGLLAYVGYPWLRRLQRRFGKASGAAMVSAVIKNGIEGTVLLATATGGPQPLV